MCFLLRNLALPSSPWTVDLLHSVRKEAGLPLPRVSENRWSTGCRTQTNWTRYHGRRRLWLAVHGLKYIACVGCEGMAIETFGLRPRDFRTSDTFQLERLPIKYVSWTKTYGIDIELLRKWAWIPTEGYEPPATTLSRFTLTEMRVVWWRSVTFHSERRHP